MQGTHNNKKSVYVPIRRIMLIPIRYMFSNMKDEMQWKILISVQIHTCDFTK